MTENVNLRCPLIWAAVLIEAQADGDERAAMAMDELRRLGVAGTITDKILIEKGTQ